MKILVIGSAGQIGTELVPALRKKYGPNNVVAGWRSSQPDKEIMDGPNEQFDVMDIDALKKVIEKHDIKQIYQLASLLSAVGEKKPMLAWKVNMDGLVNVLRLAKEFKLSVFWPSSIAVFGPTTPMDNTPQETLLSPITMYGITKRSGELLANYYFEKEGVDIRSIRYPGLISWKALPGGGTTDYAVDIFHKALKDSKYTSFLKKGTMLPMMYMDDAIRATIELMEAPAKKIKIRESYNLAAISFTPEQLAAEIKKHISSFKISFKPDFRQEIAESWPNSIDDSSARKHWNWKPKFDLANMTEDMIKNLRTS